MDDLYARPEQAGRGSEESPRLKTEENAERSRPRLSVMVEG